MSKYKGTYLDLDTIFDTRLPIAMAISPDNTAIELANNNYFKRYSNNIGYIPSDVFLAFYSKRNKNILKYAKITKILDDLVFPQYFEILKDGSSIDIDKLPPFYINIYPYDLNTKEIDTLSKGLSNIFKKDELNLINIPLKDITNRWVNDNVDILYMYEGMKWLEYRAAVEDLYKEPLVGTSLVVPMLIYDNKYKMTKESLINLIEKYKPVIDLYPVEPDLFSIRL